MLQWYCQNGWQLVPLKRKTKSPRTPKWPEAATSDWQQVSQWQNCNYAVLLGGRSGIIDIECDGEEAERDLRALCEDVQICAYSSARGIHTIWQWQPNLPDVAVLKYGKLEFRIGNKAALSCVPPSEHPSGVEYKWVTPPWECTPPPLPRRVLAAIALAQAGAMLPVTDIVGVHEGSRNEHLTKLAGLILAQIGASDCKKELARAALHALNGLNEPPLDSREVDCIFDSIWRRESKRNPKSRSFRLVIVNAEPPVFELYNDDWTKPVKLTAKQLLSFNATSVAVLEQIRVVLSPKYSRNWRQLVSDLVATAEEIESPPELKRLASVADALLDWIYKRKTPPLQGRPDPNGRPTHFQDGTVIFGFEEALRELHKSVLAVSRAELLSVVNSVGATNKQFGGGEWRGKRYKVLSVDAVRELKIKAGRDENAQDISDWATGDGEDDVLDERIEFPAF